MLYIKKYTEAEQTEHSEIIINKEYSGINAIQFGYQHCSPLWSFGPAVREHWLLHFIVSGSGIFKRDGKTHRLGAGDIFVIPPRLETYYEADGKKPWHYIWIGFTSDIKLPDAFSSPVIKIPGAKNIFEGMLRCGNMGNGKSEFLNSKIWELISLTLEADTGDTDYIEKALNCINSEYMYGISVNRLAEQLNIDRSYFSTLFRQKVGMPPGRYLMNLRLEKAAELMTVYDKSPSTAAFSVGYNDIYHFSKVFKQKFGCSPRTYRKNFLSNKQAAFRK